MKNLYFTLIFIGISTVSFAQSESKLWIGIDGSYWQKSVKGISSPDFDAEYSGSIRPIVGYGLNKKWSLGIMANYQSYTHDEGTVSYLPLNFVTGGTGDKFSVRYFTKNTVFGLGAFVRREFELSEKLSFNLSLYTMLESGSEGGIFQDYNFAPCANCLSIGIPSEVPFSEINWRTGLDVAFGYQANNWLKLELRANLLELRLQDIYDPNPESNSTNPAPSKTSLKAFYGNFTDFGSAVSRDGIRFGLVFTPF